MKRICFLTGVFLAQTAAAQTVVPMMYCEDHNSVWWCSRENPRAPQDAAGSSAVHDDPAAWCHGIYKHKRFDAMTPDAKHIAEGLCAEVQSRRKGL